MSIKIESGVPLPEPKGKYPFADMDIGDSFAVPIGEGGAVRTSASVLKRSHSGLCFVTRAVEEGQQKVIRVWRTA